MKSCYCSQIDTFGNERSILQFLFSYATLAVIEIDLQEGSVPMPLLKNHYTSKDYWNLPEGERAELIDGTFYNMALPSRLHQGISGQVYKTLTNYIDAHHGSCINRNGPGLSKPLRRRTILSCDFV